MSAATRLIPNLVIAALGVAAAVIAAGYGVIGDDGRIGPGFLPALCGVLLVLFAVVNSVSSHRNRTSAEDIAERLALGSDAGDHGLPVEEPDEDGVDIYGRSQRQRDRMLWAVVGIILATVLLIPVLGFIVAFAVMLVVIAVAVERRKILPSLMVSVITLAVTYTIFVVLLQVPLPQGLLGI